MHDRRPDRFKTFADLQASLADISANADGRPSSDRSDPRVKSTGPVLGYMSVEQRADAFSSGLAIPALERAQKVKTVLFMERYP